MKTWQIALLALLASLVVACGPKKINSVLADPQRYANKNVQVQGSVVESYSVVGRGAYRIQDDTGELWIVSERGVPRKGARVQVKGKIRDGFNLGSLSDLLRLPDRFRSGLVMIEASHKAKN